MLPLNNYNVEIIIKDNSDKQDISNLNEEFKFKNYQFFYSEDDGIYDAMNFAINKSNGRYLYFLNAGDQYYNCEIDKYLQNCDNKFDYFYGGFINLYPFLRVVNYPKFMNKYYIYIKFICHQSVIFHRRVFKKIGYYDTNLKVESDILLIAEMVAYLKGKKLDNYVSIYKGKGLSTYYQSSKEEREYYLQKKERLYSKFELIILKGVKRTIEFLIFCKNYFKIKKMNKEKE